MDGYGFQSRLSGGYYNFADVPRTFHVAECEGGFTDGEASIQQGLESTASKFLHQPLEYFAGGGGLFHGHPIQRNHAVMSGWIDGGHSAGVPNIYFSDFEEPAVRAKQR